MTAPVAIAVVSWNTRELLHRCLVSLHPEVRAGRASVVVIDNASEDGSAELVRSQFGWAQLVASETNLGFGPAVNLAVARTKAPWIAPANADIELRPGALGRLLAAGAADPGAGIIAPRLLLADGSTQHSVHPFPTLRFTVAFALGLLNASGDRFTLEGHWNPDRERRVDWALGAFLLVRREAWTELGGFPPQQWMYAEDLDLGWRAARAGFATRYVPGAHVEHVGAAATTQAWGAGVRARWMRSTYAWMLRTRGPAITWACGLTNVLGAGCRVLAATPGALADGSRRARWHELRRWTWLHLQALLAASRGGCA